MVVSERAASWAAGNGGAVDRAAVADLLRFATSLEVSAREVGTAAGLGQTDRLVLTQTFIDPGTHVGSIARRLNLSKSIVSLTAQRLVELGLIEQVENPDDRRYMLLHVTDAAHQLGAEMLQRIGESMPALDSWDGEVPARFRELLRTVSNSLWSSAFRLRNEQD